MTWLNLLLLLTLGAIWGASFLFIKVAVGQIGVMTLACARVILGAAALHLVVQLKGYRLGGWSVWKRLLVVGILGIFLPFGAITWGQQYIPAGLASILNATMPLFTYLLSLATGGEKLGGQRVIGLALGFAGIVILAWPQPGEAGSGSWRLWGELAIIFASICYAFSLTYARHNLNDQPPLVISFGQVSVGALLFLPFALLEQPWTMQFSPTVILSILALGILGTAISYMIYYHLLSATGTTWTSLVSYVVPVFGVLWGCTILGERIAWNSIAGLGVILLGMLLISNPFAKMKRAASLERSVS